MRRIRAFAICSCAAALAHVLALACGISINSIARQDIAPVLSRQAITITITITNMRSLHDFFAYLARYNNMSYLYIIYTMYI